MTMVAACHFDDGAIVIADSRVTWEKAFGKVFSDTAQKIFPLAPKVALAFAGDVLLATNIAKQMKASFKKHKRLRAPSVIAGHLPRVAKYCFEQYEKVYERKTGQKCSVSFILTGIEHNSKILLWVCESPAFILRCISKSSIVIGSGNIVADYLQQKHTEIIAKGLALKNRADELLIGLEDELKKHGVDTVGGLFQTILLSSQGIAPLSYGFFDIDPEIGGRSKEMRFENGRWIQRNLAAGVSVPLLSPLAILQSQPISKQFHDYDSPLENKQSFRWHLNYFITCLKVNRDFEKTEFEGIMSEVGAYYFPRSIPILASVGLWGSNGDHRIDFYLYQDGRKELVYEKIINLRFMPEQQEFDFPLILNIQKPGSVFLDCYIGKQFLGRRALYFDLVIRPTLHNQEEFVQFQQKTERQLIEKHQTCADPELSKVPALLEYFILCEKIETAKCRYGFIREPKAVYWKSYPLSYRVTVAIGIRLSPGEYKITVDLVNVANRLRIEIGNMVVSATSDCMMVPIEGDLIARIPSKGPYFFNVYVDDKFIGSSFLTFEDDNPSYSYTLRDFDIQRVKSGELIALMKRSIQNV